MKLPQDKRHFLKEPLGNLFEDSVSAFDYIDSLDYDKLFTVGDFTSVTFLRNDYEIDILVVDFLVERTPAGKERKDILEEYSAPVIEVKNPSGHITEELWDAFRDVDHPKKIYVNGEEDLATIPAVLLASNGSVVAYGQPGEGVVLVEVDESKKNEFKQYIDFFEGSKAFLEEYDF